MSTSAKAAERHLLVTVRSKPAQCPQVRALLLELVPLVRGEPGCLYYHLFQQADDPTAFVLASGWATDEAVAAHPTHPQVPGVLHRLLPLLASPWEVLPTRRISESPA